MTFDGDTQTAEDSTKVQPSRRNPFALDEDIPVKDRMVVRPNWLFILALIGCAAFWATVIAIVLRAFK